MIAMDSGDWSTFLYFRYSYKRTVANVPDGTVPKVTDSFEEGLKFKVRRPCLIIRIYCSMFIRSLDNLTLCIYNTRF